MHSGWGAGAIQQPQLTVSAVARMLAIARGRTVRVVSLAARSDSATVNGVDHPIASSDDRSLLQVLREDLV